MALLIRITCSACGQPVATDERTKTYTHAARGIKFDHKVVTVTSAVLTRTL